jgi:phosphoribosylamine--glycine ligase
MGAYSPAPVVTPAVDARVMREVIQPTLDGMAADGVPFSGFLYAGLMIDAHGAPRVVEFNVRFGDPETQPIMLRLRSDLLDLLEAALDGRLDGIRAEWDPRPALGVVLAADGYPAAPRSGDRIEGLDAVLPEGAKIFHAGTRLEAGHAVSAGGRVLTVCALGDDIAQARERAYAALQPIRLAGSFYRRDIGHRAIARG